MTFEQRERFVSKRGNESPVSDNNRLENPLSFLFLKRRFRLRLKKCRPMNIKIIYIYIFFLSKLLKFKQFLKQSYSTGNAEFRLFRIVDYILFQVRQHILFKTVKSFLQLFDFIVPDQIKIVYKIWNNMQLYSPLDALFNDVANNPLRFSSG